MEAVCPSEHDLQAFQLGDLSEAALDAIAQHLEVCPRCETRAQAMDTAVDPILGALRGKTTSPTAGPPTRQIGPAVVTPPAPAADGPPPPPSSTYPFLQPPQQPGEMGRLPNYRVVRLLGSGGMAHVFQAEDLSLGRAVALKVMKPELANDADGVKRFLREARLMASIKHDHLATVYEVRQEGAVVFLAMELLEGEHLYGWQYRVGVPDVPEILRVGRELAAGLAAIHKQGLIHRDLKPANIWREAPTGRIKILDFGLARLSHEDAALTQPGMIVGTPAYLSPEQARGAKLGPASDLFSLGSVLYGLCTGRGPFSSESVMEVLTSLAVDHPPPPHEINPKIPLALSGLVMQLLSKSPENRPASADDVAEVLRQIETGAPLSLSATQGLEKALLPPSSVKLPPPPPTPGPRRRWARWAAGGLLATALAAAAALWFFVLAPFPRPPIAVNWPRPGEDGVFLSDLRPVAEENYFFVPPDTPDVTGRMRPSPKTPQEIPIVIDGRHWPHGIFMHPAPGRDVMTSLTYRLDRKYRKLYAFVTLNDGPGSASAPLYFHVIGDGKELWKSKAIPNQSAVEQAAVSVEGVETLKIGVTGSDYFLKGAHAAWVEPYLEK